MSFYLLFKVLGGALGLATVGLTLETFHHSLKVPWAELLQW